MFTYKTKRPADIPSYRLNIAERDAEHTHIYLLIMAIIH